MPNPYEDGITELDRLTRVIDEAIANRCADLWLDGDELICGTHDRPWENGVPFCVSEEAPLIWALVGPVSTHY